MAPHVARALGRAAAPPAARSAAQAKPAMGPGAARHVAQAVAAAHRPHCQPQAKPARPAAPGPAARHTQAALRPAAQLPGAQRPVVQRQEDGDEGARQREAFAKLDASRGAGSDYVTYPDLKTGGAPPPPPRRAVYALSCDGGSGCRLKDVKTGRQSDAGDLWGGFVRMAKNGPIYVSPRSGLGGPGDGHPSIASVTPEGMAGRRSVVAAGEIGILGGNIVGHNDKTGHFQSRKNRRQSGLPADLYHPFTEDPREWYHS